MEEAGEYNRAKRWCASRNSEPYEFMSFMSFYNPSASNFYENNAKKEANNTQQGSETNSRNSETHTGTDEPEGDGSMTSRKQTHSPNPPSKWGRLVGRDG